MQEIQLSLSPAERDFLVELLEHSLSEGRVEVRRAEFSTDFRHELQQQQELVRGLLDKITRAPASA